MRRALLLCLALGAGFSAAMQLAVAPLGDAIAGSLVAPPLRARTAPAPALAAAESEPDGEVFGPPVALPRRVASRAPAPHRTTVDEAKDAGAPASPPAPDAPPKATIAVPASVVTRAIEKRDVGATNALAPDGSPLGARLVGVSKYRTGLRDGDVVVSVAGTRTPTVAAMIAVGMKAASGGATRISGRIVRGDATYTVVIDLPK